MFLTNNCIVHKKSAPYHPSTNGLAERAVQILKQGPKKNTEGRLSRCLHTVGHLTAQQVFHQLSYSSDEIQSLV